MGCVNCVLWLCILVVLHLYPCTMIKEVGFLPILQMRKRKYCVVN